MTTAEALRICVCALAIVPALGAGRSALAASASEELPASWLAQVEQQIRESEYHFSLQQDGEWSAPNRAHGLRAKVSSAGIVVTSQTHGGDAAEDGWTLGLALVAWGRSGALHEIEAARCSALDNRTELARDRLTEWYVNSDAGLEQGFTVDSPPEVGRRHGPLVLEMELTGGLGAFPSEDGQAVVFKTGQGVPVLRYAGLKVADGTGAAIPARIAFDRGRLRILVEDEGAVYPLAVDPLMTSPAWTAESNQVSALFGYSVATAGDVNGDGFSDVIVGAYQYDNVENNEGRAFVYLGSAAGLATSAAWTAESNQGGTTFGNSVATAGDVNGDGFSDVIVGAYQYDNVETDEGRAFVYLGSAAGLATSAAWTAESNQGSALFGVSVATAGDVNGDGFSDVIVGAYDYTNGQTREGRAFVYLGSAAGLATSAAWTAESNQATAGLGISVATAGDVNGDGFSDVIVGAHQYDNVETDEGRAFVYLGSGAGLATSAAWTAESNQPTAQLGYWVATAGDVNGDGYSDVLVGANQYDNGENDEGRAYVYLGSASGPLSSAAWTAESNQATALFGASVATAGDVNGDGFGDVVVGAYQYTNGEANEGRAFVYFGSAAGLAAAPAWTAESNQVDAFFGYSVTTAGDVNGDGFSDVIVSASQYDNPEGNEGRASLYLGSASGLATSSAWTAASNQASAFFGYSVATAGDVNGDGFSDVIVGAYAYDNGETNEGRAFVYLGSAAGLATSAAWTAEGNLATAFFGVSVATAGDVNGDGFSDVIVGAYAYTNVQTDEGRAFVYLGSAAGLATSPAWTAESNQTFASFGISVATAGDVNGDGFSDVIVGAGSYDNVESGEGRAYVYLGSAAGLATSAAWTAESNQASAQFGISVATAGDVNGDGFSDVIVGANLYDNPESGEGGAFVYLGSAAGLATSAAWTAESNQGTANFGISVATAGDVNGDGFSDVIVGAYAYTNVESQEGRAFVYLGSAAGLATSAAWTAESNQVNANFGISVATASDVNGDSFSDVIVGAYQYDNVETSEGRAFVYLGSAAGLATSAAWTAESNQGSALFGRSVATAGDVNGDGFSDVIVGAEIYDNGQSQEGRAFLYYGNSGDGLDRIARQARAVEEAPIAPLGKSESQTSFRLRALGRTPAGRGKVRLEWEHKLLGEPFDGTDLEESAATDTGAPAGGSSAVALEETLGGVPADSVHHWRLRILTDSPFFPRSPWLTLPHNGPNEADLRTTGSVGPQVIKVSPPNNAEGVAAGASIVVEFSEDIDASSIDVNSFRLLDGGTPITATRALSPSRRLATLNPTAALTAGKLYTVDFTSGVEDLFGNALQLAPDPDTSFRVAATPGGGGGFDPDTTDPLPGAVSQTRHGVSVSAAGDLNGPGAPPAFAFDSDLLGAEPPPPARDFVVGAPGFQVGANVEAGAAIVYLGSSDPDELRARDIVFTGVDAHERAGVSVSGDFDFNGDGIKDLLIGAEQINRSGSADCSATSFQCGPGKVYLIYFRPVEYDFDLDGTPDYEEGSPITVSLGLVGTTISGAVFTGQATGDQAGFAVAGSDVLWPGSASAIVIGAPGRNVGASADAGSAYLIFQSTPPLSGTGLLLSNVAGSIAGVRYDGAAAGDQLGFAVAFPGDVTAAPGDDIAIGAPWADPPLDAGAVYVPSGGSVTSAVVGALSIGTTPTAPGARFVGIQADMRLGYSVAGGGDNFADGRDDLLLGAPLFDLDPGLLFGEASFGSPIANVGFLAQASSGSDGIIEVCNDVGNESGSPAIVGRIWTGVEAGDQLGSAAGSLRNVLSGYDTIAIGAPCAGEGNDCTTAVGHVYVIAGGTPAPTELYGGFVSAGTVATTNHGAILAGTQAGEHAGASIAGTGDIDGGGGNDFVFGAPDRDDPAADVGTVYIVLTDDGDDDGRVNTLDCNVANSQVWDVPSVARSFTLSYNRNSGVTTLDWTAPLERGGTGSGLGAITYDTIRSPSRTDFVTAAVCVETDGTDTTSSEMFNPAPGAMAFYLVVAQNSCGPGSAGTTSSGVEHNARACP